VVRAEAAARLRLGQVAAHRYTLLDVFTATPLEGNPIAVVHDAGGVPDAVMHAFARETRLSETSFIQPPDADGADYRHRIWTMKGEIPFAGHPSLGVAAAVAHARGERRATYVQQTVPGLQPVEVELGDRVARVSMLQEPARHGPELDPGEVLPMAGLEAGDADPALPVQVVSTGVPQILVPVRDAAVLARIRPDYDRIGALIEQHEAVVLYLCAVDGERVRARSFMSTAEMGEDPATGSAAGPLAAYVAARTGVQAITIDQGAEIGRPSVMRAAVEGDRIRVGGDAVVVVDGTVQLDT
jgi:trans-2,3-dihydro-3-hydroxyanthranilate isomerase